MPCWSAVPTAPGPSRPALDAALGAAGLGDINDVEVLAPWSVARVHLASKEPETVVVKWLREPSGQRPADAAQLDTERAALGFMDQRCPGLAPRLIGADAFGSLLVLEDLAPRRSLLELIVEDELGWGAELVRFAETLGQLHAATVGAADAYYRRRRALGPVDPDRELVRFSEPRPDLVELSDRLDVPVDHRTAADLDAVAAELGAPGPFLAFSNGDSGATTSSSEKRAGASSTSSSPATATA